MGGRSEPPALAAEKVGSGKGTVEAPAVGTDPLVSGWMVATARPSAPPDPPVSPALGSPTPDPGVV